MLRNTPKHHFWSNKLDWMRSRQKNFRSSVPRNSAFNRETQVSHDFSCRRVAKCFEIIPNIILGPTDQIGCICGKTFSENLVPQNSAFSPETQVSNYFSCRRVAKCLEIIPNINLGLTGQIGCIRGKTFSESSVPRISAFSSKTQVFHYYLCRRFVKCSETLPNIIFGRTSQTGCVRGKKISNAR